MPPALAEMDSPEMGETDDSAEDTGAEAAEAKDPYVQAMDLLKEALADDDSEAAADALKSFVQMCTSDQPAAEKGGKPSLMLAFKKDK